MRRYLILLSSLLMQVCLGATYAWSVFVQPYRDLTGLSQGAAQLPFTLFYFAFPLTLIFSGRLLSRLGPRRCALTGGLLFGGGWLLASLGHFHYLMTALGIGVVAGIGVGFSYLVPIAVGIQWFPRQKGLVTGIAVAGFGGGAALIGRAGSMLVQEWGKSPFEAFGLLGLVFLLLICTAALAMEFPPGYRRDAADRLPALSVIRLPGFGVLYAAMIAGLAAGFSVLANLKQLSAVQFAETGVAAVMLFAVANAAGRVLWGSLFDRVKAATVLGANLVFQAAILLAFPVLLHGTGGFLLFAALAGFNYGGILVLYASSSARIWGSEQIGQTYGILFSANIVAAPVPVITGFLYDATGSFAASMAGLAILLLAAALLIGTRASTLNRRAARAGEAEG